MNLQITDARGALNTFWQHSRRGMGAPILVMSIMAMMIVPLPPFMLDVFFSFNIALSLIILLVVAYVMRPLEFASFPMVLLIATLLRLALNVASTRVVLLEGHQGGAAAGKVIESFGEFVIGGNYAVGLVVFAILVIINFVVVTKGAGRISEVTARFTLDAMPGKQMAIDADLNAGLISQDEARTRRSEVAQEADFYGAMDGASKFVRGDAVAGIIILFINIIGGLLIGMLQHDLGFVQAMEYYALLTIGDGLVAQIPSLLLSLAAGVIITRVSASADMSEQIAGQLFSNPRPLAVSAGILGLMGVVPGMPNVAFLTLAALFGGLAWWTHRRKQMPVEEIDDSPLPAVAAAASPMDEEETRELSWDDVQPVDVIGLEVGYGLIPLVDKAQGGQLMKRIKGVRKKLSQELGFLVQPVHIRDNLNLPPNGYRISLSGVTSGEAELLPGKFLAINPGTVYGDIDGTQTRDPAFGLEAVWIDAARRDHAQTLGYTVVDDSTVAATHLSQIIKSRASQLLGHEEAQRLLDGLTERMPRLVEDLVPERLPLAVVVKVLQNLLAEEVSIRDLRTIIETLAEYAPQTQDAGILTARVRVALGRLIVQQINNLQSEMPVSALDPALEQLLLKSQQGDGQGLGLEPQLAERLHSKLGEFCQQQEIKGEPAILLAPGVMRAGLARWLRGSLPQLKVLAYDEVPAECQIRVVSSISG